MARILWTTAAGLVGLLALLVASLSTFMAIPIWIVSNMVGVGLIVFGGWSAPARSSIEAMNTSRLEEWAADVADDLVEPQVTSDWNNANDPLLAAQQESTAELRRHNDLVAAQQQADRATAGRDVAGGHSVRPVATSQRRRQCGGGLRWIWLVAVASVLLAAGLLGGALLLSIAASWNSDAEPPTFAEIEAGIHQRTAERQAARAAEFEARFPDHPEVIP